MPTTRLRRRILRRISFLRRNRCCLLVVALCAMILTSPLLSHTVIGGIALTLILLGVLVLATWALRVGRPTFWTAVVLAATTGAVVATHRTADYGLLPVVQCLSALYLGIVTVLLLRYVLDYHLITTDKVFGAVGAYILIAFTFASLFSLLLVYQPDAFYISTVNDPDGRMSWADMMYFSFTVLTSTGFGEITPVTGMARSLIIIEQVLGVMYVAFLVARLANLYGLHGRS
jgi:hypothetical protein